MSISLDQLLSEADELIEKHAGTRKTVDVDEDIFKLAEKLMSNEDQEVFVETPIEKVARAIAIVEAIQSINNASKLDGFEKAAMEQGHTEEEIDTFLGEQGLLPLHKTLTIPEGLLC